MASMRSIGVRLRLFIDQYKQEAQQAKQATESIGTGAKKATHDLDELAGQMTIVGGLMAAAFGVVVFAGAKFDKQMSEVKAVSGAAADEMLRLREAALEAGAATVFSAAEAAQAEAELAKAGVATADVLGGALRGSLDLAAAGSLDLATAATIAAQAMNIFGLGGDDVAHIADVLAAAANKSATDVEQLGIGLQQVGLVANQAGFSLEETVGLLAAFADNALGGSDGATSLKTALLRLMTPLPEARATMEQFGISLYDANGAMVDAVTITGQLEQGLGDLSEAERNAALMNIFGQDAIRAGNVLIAEGAAGIKEYIDAVNEQGAAAKVAEEKLDNLAGDVTALTGSLETLFIKASEGGTPALRFLTQQFTAITNAIGSLPGGLQAALLGLVGLSGAALLATAAFVKTRAGLASVNAQLLLMGPAGAKAAAGLRFVTAAGGPLIIAAAAIASGIDQMLDADFTDRARRLQVGKIVAEDLKLAEGSIKTIEDLDEALASLAAEGRGMEALNAFGNAASQLGISLEEARALFPQYAESMRFVGDATIEQARAAENAQNANIALAGKFGEAANAADGLRTAFLLLNGATLGWRDAERAAEAAVDDLQEALKESNGSLDVHEAKGRAAAAAVDEVAIKAAEAAQAKFDETKSVQEANAVYQDYITQLRGVLIAAGHSTTEVDKLVGAIAKMPEFKATTISIQANVKVGSNGRLGIPIANVPVFLADGGITRAATGLIQQGQPGISNRPVLWAEEGTEAYIPKTGNRSRAMSILSEAAGWHGADVVPRGGYMTMPSMAQPVNVAVTVSPGPGLGGAITDGLRFDVTQTAGADVQQQYGRRGRV